MSTIGTHSWVKWPCNRPGFLSALPPNCSRNATSPVGFWHHRQDDVWWDSPVRTITDIIWLWEWNYYQVKSRAHRPLLQWTGLNPSSVEICLHRSMLVLSGPGWAWAGIFCPLQDWNVRWLSAESCQMFKKTNALLDDYSAMKFHTLLSMWFQSG